ncbi:SLC13 family permease [Paracraurococcus lichenis]|uniref:SLC13 family permease n=1 Tax=Paracraurococcus lichenis TaxID=3064888 RepID=A0ABT9E5V2_9PROT|nr:SLC13 family permease [Paracraurococcus sp. LOR1-02]MDO9711511.1 SLC13 family permease [Paracraurococcus sp. LOR1-02]
MSPQTATILGLVAMFVIATALPINMGALGLAMAFLIGTTLVGMTANQIIAGFPGDLFVTLVGITYLFAIAQKNGTIDWLVHQAVRAVRGRIAAIPWIMFGVAAALTAVGAVSPAACAILAPVALQFARQYKISPLMMGLLVIHGAQGGGFSPISIYGGITNQVVARSGLPVGETSLFLASLFYNLLCAVGVFLAFGGRDLLGRRAMPDGVTGDEHGPVGLPMYGHGTSADAAIAAPAHPALARLDLQQMATLVGLAALAVGALAFNMNVGLVAVTVAVVLTLLAPSEQKGAVDKIGWSTILLVGGVITYVGVLQKSGAIDSVGQGVSGMGAPLLAALLLCYIGGVVSAFASSVGVLGAIIPLAVPFLQQGQIGVAGMIAALAISSTVVDVSPFSTNGALVVANAAPEERDSVYKRFLIYSILVVLAGPPLAWLIFILPGWM